MPAPCYQFPPLPLLPKPAMPWLDERFTQCVDFERSPELIAVLGVPLSKQKSERCRRAPTSLAPMLLYRYPDGTEALVPRIHYNENDRCKVEGLTVSIECESASARELRERCAMLSGRADRLQRAGQHMAQEARSAVLDFRTVEALCIASERKITSLEAERAAILARMPSTAVIAL